MPDADVIIAGFRCAGAPLAYSLHRRGVKVIVVDKAPFFGDQPISTHAIQPYGMKVLDKLGLADVVRALAPPNRAFRFQVEDSFMQVDLEGTDLESYSPRRSVLDPALQRAALDAGVEARERTRVLGVLRDGARVCGVRVHGPQGEYELRAPLVVGADGRNSTIAKLVEAPTYLQSETTGCFYWSYFERPPLFDSDPRYRFGACIHIEGNQARAVFQTDSGLLLMAGGGRGENIEEWRRDPAAALLAHLGRGRLTAPLLDGRMVNKPLGVLGLQFFMKQAAGPGWALVGDSGLHMDPTPGLGITDAVRDALDLSDAIVAGGERPLLLYWRRRDTESLGLYHFAGDMGSEGYNNALTRLLFDRSQSSAAMKARMLRMMDRQLRPQDMVPPHTILGWLLTSALKGNVAPLACLGRSLRFGRMVMRQQQVLDRALAVAEGGGMDWSVPVLAA